MKLFKTALIIIVSSLILLSLFGLYAYKSPALNISKERYISIDSSDNSETISNKLESTCGLKFPFIFKAISDKINLNRWVKAGRYTLTPEMNLVDLAKVFREGKMKTVNLVIRPLITLEKFAALCGEKLEGDSADYYKILTDTAFCKSIGFSKETIYALILPDTYNLYWHTSAEELLSKLLEEYIKYWIIIERKEKAEAIGLTTIEVSILASIVSKETNKNDEMPMVAGMYLNRLRIGMPLQADPTIKFALNQPSLKRVLKVHLSVQSPYNTYLNKGLPPGPICVPSKQSIDAVLNAATHNFLYMCAKEDFSGYHNFAKDYNLHLQNAKRYQKALNERGITE
jgi:UPF0755 protein